MSPLALGYISKSSNFNHKTKNSSHFKMEADEIATFLLHLGDLWDVGVKHVGRQEECLLSVLLC